MPNIVYKIDVTKPEDPVVLGNALNELQEMVGGRQNILKQAIAAKGPGEDDGIGRAACFLLNNEGMQLFRDGFPGSGEWKEWPQSTPEPDFSRYPLGQG